MHANAIMREEENSQQQWFLYVQPFALGDDKYVKLRLSLVLSF